MSPPLSHGRGQDGFVRRDTFRRAIMRYVPSASNERVDLVLAEILGSLGDLGHGAATRGGGGEAAAPGTAPSGVSHDGDRGSSVGGGVDGGAGNGEMVLTKAAWCSAMASWLQVFDHRNPLATHTDTQTYMPPHATHPSCPVAIADEQ